MVGFAKQYVKNVGIALWNLFVGMDKFVNGVFLFGDPNETISSRADKAMRAGKEWGCVLCWFLGKIQKKHCQKSLQVNAGSLAIIPDDK